MESQSRLQDNSYSINHNNTYARFNQYQVKEENKDEDHLVSLCSDNGNEYELEITKHPQSRPLNSVQLDVWKDLFNQNSTFMFELWFEHFSFIERVQIWNSVSFSNKFYLTLLVENESSKEKQNLDELDQKAALAEMSDLELKKFVDIIFKEYKVIYQSIDQSTKSSFKSLFKKCK